MQTGTVMQHNIWDRPDGTVDRDKVCASLRDSVRYFVALGLKDVPRPCMYPMNARHGILVVDDVGPIFILRLDVNGLFRWCATIDPSGDVRLEDERLLLPLAEFFGDCANTLGEAMWRQEEARMWVEIQEALGTDEVSGVTEEGADDIPF
jgi:hypothetical protein